MPRKAVSASDATLALALPFYAALAWVAPERRWRGICRVFSGVARRFGAPNPLIAKVERALPAELSDVGGAAIVRELEEGRREHFLQIFRAYRPGGWRPDMEIIGLDHIAAAQNAGRGVVLWIDHFVFNGLLPKQAFAEAGMPYSHLSRPEHGFSKTEFGVRFLNPLRSKIEDAYLKQRVVIERGAEERSVRRILQLLRRGEIVSITAGAWEGRNVEYARVFGRDYPLATGAPAVAFRAGAALIPVSVYRCRETEAFKVRLAQPISLKESTGKAEAIAHALQSYGQHLEPLIRKYPGQWRGWGYLVDRRQECMGDV